VELTLVTERLRGDGRIRRVRLASTAEAAASEYGPRGGFKRARRAVRAGARVALATRAGDTIVLLLDRPATSRAGGETHGHPNDSSSR
jgi:hypothetical protein